MDLDLQGIKDWGWALVVIYSCIFVYLQKAADPSNCKIRLSDYLIIIIGLIMSVIPLIELWVNRKIYEKLQMMEKKTNTYLYVYIASSLLLVVYIGYSFFKTNT